MDAWNGLLLAGSSLLSLGTYLAALWRLFWILRGGCSEVRGWNLVGLVVLLLDFGVFEVGDLFWGFDEGDEYGVILIWGVC